MGSPVGRGSSFIHKKSGKNVVYHPTGQRVVFDIWPVPERPAALERPFISLDIFRNVLKGVVEKV
ncbi:unnamed protein product [Orchesella dallaii]|uniref:Uncharacterized protein n=1 Tax=Orchesella dallaii TaxID=48710 RepID=A0ABP1RNA7_9HEXA